MTEAVKSTSRPTNAPAAANPSQAIPDPLWARLFLPSATDIIFLALFWMLTFGAWAPGLLADADTGWHIRNGEHILRTLSIPRTDYFSYTMPGQPWYAWEWLYDALLGGIHILAGLNGVVVFTALLIALTFAMLFRWASETSDNIVVAAVLTLISGAAATIHILARPHVLSWLLSLIYLRGLQRYQRGERTHLYWMPVLMLLWVNLHGGFLIGLTLIALFLTANGWTWVTSSYPERLRQARERVRHLAIIEALTVAATMATPYGFRLHLHLYEYLGSTFLMNHISEFQTPDFHSTPAKFFAALLALSVIALAMTGARLTVVDLFVVLFSAWAGLFAARNIPIAAILLTLTIARLLGEELRDTADRSDIAMRLRSFAESFSGFAGRMETMERRFCAHLWPVAIVLAAAGIALSQGQVFGRTVLKLNFDETQMPVAATEYLVRQNVRDHFYSPDNWGGYLIYRMYPDIGLFMDDRHDFFGESFVRDYMKVARVQDGWREVLARHQVNHVVVGPESALAGVLRAQPEWRVEYEDKVAVVLKRL